MSKSSQLRKKMKAAFIALEGLEGAGKSTVISGITEYLESIGKQVITTREPGGTPMAEAIRDCVKQNWDETVTQETELLLMYAARSQLVENIIKPALKNNTFVIGDRHDLSTVAYQGGGRGIPLAQLDNLRLMTLGEFTPDFTLYLDIDPKVGLSRARGRGELDRIEQAGLEFFDRARAMYKQQVSNMSQARIIDAHQSPELVKQDAVAAIQSWLNSQL